jgi:hypothetical protein
MATELLLLSDHFEQEMYQTNVCLPRFCYTLHLHKFCLRKHPYPRLGEDNNRDTQPWFTFRKNAYIKFEIVNIQASLYWQIKNSTQTKSRSKFVYSLSCSLVHPIWPNGATKVLKSHLESVQSRSELLYQVHFKAQFLSTLHTFAKISFSKCQRPNLQVLKQMTSRWCVWNTSDSEQASHSFFK